MTPHALAQLHRRCFTSTRPWSAAEFSDLLASPLIFLVSDINGFALGRAITDEAELLTIAVDPDHQNTGIGTRILERFVLKSVENGAHTIFLEVAANNLPAIRLYQKYGFSESSRRSAYYSANNGEKVDALIMRKSA